MNLRSLLSLFSNDLAIDLGTANSLVYTPNRGIVVNEPSVVAINKLTDRVEAIGHKAKEMLGRTPRNIVAIKPLKDGVIADFDLTEQMLKYFIKQAHARKRLLAPRIVISIPSEITQVERRAIIQAARGAKASEVYLVKQAMAAAIGVGLPISEPSGNMIIDIGGGTTDIALISLSGIVYGRTVRVAGDEMDNSIIQYMKRKHNLLIGERKYIASLGGSGRPETDFPRYLAWFEEGRLKLDDLVTRRYRLEQINEALRDLQEGRIAGRSIIEY